MGLDGGKDKLPTYNIPRRHPETTYLIERFGFNVFLFLQNDYLLKILDRKNGKISTIDKISTIIDGENVSGSSIIGQKIFKYLSGKRVGFTPALKDCVNNLNGSDREILILLKKYFEFSGKEKSKRLLTDYFEKDGNSTSLKIKVDRFYAFFVYDESKVSKVKKGKKNYVIGNGNTNSSTRRSGGLGANGDRSLG